ncbi:MAG: folate-binding protein YgfZ [Cohaesibacteraceae bacterium]|nr:folate-binding protein YgfZ [Cohaesibacteraceae bacterium]
MIAHLASRAIVSISGNDAFELLQKLVTPDMSKITGNVAGYGALLSPQGKIQFDFHIQRQDDCWLFDIRSSHLEAFTKRMRMYKMRSEVEINLRSDLQVFANWNEIAPGGVDDARLPVLGTRRYASEANCTHAEEDYFAHQNSLGVPEGDVDFIFGETFPHDVNMDDLNGLFYEKGCYVGQEVVSRIFHRASARRRTLLVKGQAALPPKGTPITTQGKTIGYLGQSVNNQGIAIVRIDHAKNAIDEKTLICANEIELTLQLPPYAKFTWPE